MLQQQSLILLSLIACTAAMLSALLSRQKVACFCLCVAFAAAFSAFFLRCFHAWPMLPMYGGLQGTTVALMTCWLAFFRGERCRESLLLLVIILLFSCALVLFPKDFYLPLRRSITIWSWLFLLAGTVARALLLVAAVKGLVFCIGSGTSAKDPVPRTLCSAFVWAGWGFVLLTLSMFSGEIWSFLGWGTPVVWHDPAVASFMALWIYWIAFLHLHHTPGWSNSRRALFMVGGGMLVLFSFRSDLGPFLPFFPGMP